MEYTKILLRAELCTVAASALYARDLELTEQLNKAVYNKISNTPAPSTGKPLKMNKDEVKNLRIDHMVIVPTEETIHKYEFNKLGDEVYISVRILGIVFETDNTEDVEFVINSLVEDPEIQKFDGFSWKYFDPEVDIPQRN